MSSTTRKQPAARPETDIVIGAGTKLPQVHPQGIEFVHEAGWNCLLHWLEQHAPEDVHQLAMSLNFLGWLKEHPERCQDDQEPDWAVFYVITAMNAMLELEHWR